MCESQASCQRMIHVEPPRVARVKCACIRAPYVLTCEPCRGVSRGGVMRNAIVLGLASLLLCACGAKSVVIREPVYITRYVYVRIDPALTAPCPTAKPRTPKVRESLRVNRERRRVNEDCDARMSKIRAIEGTPVPLGVTP